MRERGDASRMLRERYRFTARWMGLPMYAFFHGYFFDDTLKVPAGATGATAQKNAPKPTVVRRFMLTKVDSLRAYVSGDCRAKRASK